MLVLVCVCLVRAGQHRVVKRVVRQGGQGEPGGFQPSPAQYSSARPAPPLDSLVGDKTARAYYVSTFGFPGEEEGGLQGGEQGRLEGAGEEGEAAARSYGSR